MWLILTLLEATAIVVFGIADVDIFVVFVVYDVYFVLSIMAVHIKYSTRESWRLPLSFCGLRWVGYGDGRVVCKVIFVSNPTEFAAEAELGKKLSKRCEQVINKF